MRDLFPLHNPLKIKGRDARHFLKRHRLSARVIWRWIKILVVIGFFGAAALFAWYSKDLPTPGRIRARQAIESTKIMAIGGELLYEVHGEENRTNLTFEEIPQVVKDATLVAEDRQFYHHYGVDFRGIARAVLLDVFTGSRVGGSTITQQFVKNALLSNQKTFDRKFKELILALELETMFSKDEIFTFYLNEIPYGSNNYGIQSAARAYYGKNAAELELHEAATLAALPQAPTYYSPYGTHTDVLLGRRNWILQSMVDLGYRDQVKADEAKTKELGVLPRRDSIVAPHFVFYVREQLVDMFDETTVETGGLRVTTTLTMDLQRAAERAVQDGMANVERRGGSNAGLVALNPKTGMVDAMVGSHDYFDAEHDGNVNVTLAERQPGSSFKPIVYATGFKGKFSPASILWDVSTDFGNYIPDNYDGGFRGPMSVRQSLAGSLNIPAVKMLGLVGLSAALETAHDLGITTLNEPERYGLSLVLGGGEVKPLDMATAFGAFANGGTYRPPVSILKVEDADGKVLFEHKQGKGEREVLDPNIAYQITDILKDNDARSYIFGSRSALFFPNRPVAAKTGTTQEYRDAWTVGYTPSMAVAVWAGNNDNSVMRKGADGSVVAAPIFKSFMTKALDERGAPVEEFAKPNTLRSVQIDRLSGQLPTDDSPELVTDLFAPWQVPTERDTIHVRVKVNRANGKLATQYTPEHLVEEKTYTVIHSERPSDIRWEHPVQNWARDHGFNIDPPPTELDDSYTAETVPDVEITSPAEGKTVAGSFTVEVTATSVLGIKVVDLQVDGKVVARDSQAPYSFSLLASDLGGQGNHILTVEAFDPADAKATDSITVLIQGDGVPPKPVTAVTAVPMSKATRLDWANPIDADLERIRIYLSTDPAVLGTLFPTEVLVTPGSISSYTVQGLAANTKYYFTLRPMDSSGNETATPPFSATATPGL